MTDLLLNPVSGDQNTLSYQSLSPTLYKVQITTDHPAYLQFSEAYHSLWQATADGVVLKHIPINNFFNGYYLAHPGQYQITVAYEAQRYGVLGAWISAAAWLSAALYFIFLWWRRHHQKRPKPTDG